MITLEDFFTLTEMRDGLSDIIRVEELVRAVQNVNDSFASNLGDAIRQWSTVASTLAATENDKCLDHFVQLDGLCFLNKWLQEALDSNADVIHNSAKELIDTLLASLDKIASPHEKLTDSGIGITVQRLLDHESVEIRMKAKHLCDKWNLARKNDTNFHMLESGDITQSDQHEHLIKEKASDNDVDEENPVATSSGMEVVKGRTGDNELADTECHDSVSPCDISSTKEDLPVSVQSLDSSLIYYSSKPASGDTVSATLLPASNIIQEFLSVIEESAVCPDARLASAGTCDVQCDRELNSDNQCDVSCEDAPDSVKEMDIAAIAEKPLCKSSPRITTDNSSSSAAAISETSQEGAMQPTESLSHLDSNATETCETKAVAPEPKSENVDTVIAKSPNILESKLLTIATKDCQEQLVSSNPRITTDLPQISCQNNDPDRNSFVKNHKWEINFNFRKGNAINCSSSFKLAGTKATKELGVKSELEFGCADDALEVARQVAIQVEREVVDYREAFCSSPEVGDNVDANSSDSEEVKQDHEVTEEEGDHSLSSKDNSVGSLCSKEGSDVTENVSSDLENLDQDLQPQKLDVSSQKSLDRSDTAGSGIDLNADIFSEEPECLPAPSMPVNVSAPVAIFASSRGSPLLPVSPLQFGGGMGWKGTAATSAFRPASPRRILESEKTYSVSKQKRIFLDIDLNVAESEDEVVVGPLAVKPMAASSSLPSGDSTTEVSSRKVDKLKLDLNRLGDEDAFAYPLLHSKVHQTGEQSLSSASSSTSKHHSLKDFDLNDNPSFLDAVGFQNLDNLSKSSGTYGVSKLDDPVITIMGSKMVVDRKEFSDRVQHSFSTNGVNIDQSALARPLLPYAHMPPPTYGYAGLPSGPAMPVPQPFYASGNFPYIDARGQAIFPHITGVAGHDGKSYRPFFMNVPASTSNSTLYGSVHPGFDVNSGMTHQLGGTREEGSFKQFLSQGKNNLVEDQIKAIPQPSSSGMPLKRKEPDSGWESYSYGYKQLT